MFLADDGSNAKRKYVHGTKLKDCTFQVGGVGGVVTLHFPHLGLFCSHRMNSAFFFFLTLIILKIPQGYKKQGGKTK